jgi:hypothetical protein
MLRMLNDEIVPMAAAFLIMVIAMVISGDDD